MRPAKATVWIGILTALFAVCAWASVRDLSATADEPLHAASGYLAAHRGDFRPDREDPAGWLRLVGWPIKARDIARPFDDAEWAATRYGAGGSTQWCGPAVYRGVAPESAVWRARPVMLAVAVVLVASIAGLAWRVAGPTAGVIAAGVCVLEPTLLGHAALVKNDVAMALCMLWACVGVWLAVRDRWRWGWAVTAGVAMAAGVVTKFSGLGVLAYGVGVLAVVAIVRRDWRPGVMAVASVVLAVTVIWAAYGWRFAATPEGPTVRGFDIGALVSQLAERELRVRGELTPEAAAAWRPSVGVRAVLECHRRELLPESYIAGLLFTRATTIWRPAYALGQYSDVGWWWYFPLAWVVKTPLALIAATVAAMWRVRWGLAVPAALYLLTAMTGGLNIGVRHLLPVYPLAIVAIAIAGATAMARWRRATTGVLALLTIGAAVEVLPERGRYIQFFNAFAGDGLAVLGDSNLDWGQDLRALVRTDIDPDAQLYLVYFGPADPRAMGLSYLNLPGSWAPGRTVPWESAEGIVAVSATHLQGIYYDAPLLARMAALRATRPIAVINNTIYLYRLGGAAVQQGAGVRP